MNDSDRGPGHAIGNSLIYGIAILPLTKLVPWWVVLIVLVLNHYRVFYQEWFLEGWKSKMNSDHVGDFYYDSLMRPLATTAFVLMFGYLPAESWFAGSIITFLISYKRSNQWPLLFFWK